ncbi:MAG TPA: hypothetical protein VMR16_03250 [Candidatus Saccharimonadales bacterium]|nr:hypothetical protein [Candidatus Saccharimonadales bacterium]
MIENKTDKDPLIDSTAERKPSEVSGLVAEKFVESWGSTFGKLGAANSDYAVRVLYRSLYAPDTLVEMIDPDQQGEASMAILQNPVELNEVEVPQEEVFVSRIVQAIKKEVDYGSKLYDGAMDVLEAYAANIPVTVWTAGDTDGSFEYPGNHQQLYKLALSGLGNLRRNILKDKDHERPVGHRNEVLSVSVSDKKLQELPEIIKTAQARGTRKLIIVEDNYDNLHFATLAANLQGLEVTPVWVRQGHHGKTDVSQRALTADGTIVIDSIAELPGVVQPEQGSELIIDFDDVIFDDDAAKIEVGHTLYKILKDNNWL